MAEIAENKGGSMKPQQTIGRAQTQAETGCGR